MKGMSMYGDEGSAFMLKYQSEQQELEYQRHILEDLEFQMFEASVLLFA